MSKINASTSPNQLSQLALKKQNNLKASNKTTTEPISGTSSLKVASNKALQTQQQKPTTVEKGIKSALSAGLEYLKDIRDQAKADREKGIGVIKGANDFWTKVNKEANDIGQKAQDKILDNLVKEGAGELSNLIKGTALEDYLGGFISSTSSKATSAATASTTTAGNVATKGVSSLGSLASGVGAAYSLYQLYDTFGKSNPVEGALNGATVGAYAGSIIPGVGTVLGGIVGGVIGAGIGLFSNKKHPEHAARDQMRDALASYGFIDKSYNIKLADGSNYSLAIDGKKTIQSLDGTNRYGYQIDFSNPQASKAIAMIQPLAEVITEGNEKLKTDLIGYLVNAATSNAKNEKDVMNNVLGFYEQSKLTKDDLAEGILNLHESKSINDNELEVYANDLVALLDTQISNPNSGDLLAA